MKIFVRLPLAALVCFSALYAPAYAQTTAESKAYNFSAPLGSGLTFLTPDYSGVTKSELNGPPVLSTDIVSILASVGGGSQSINIFGAGIVTVPVKNSLTTPTPKSFTVTYTQSTSGSTTDTNHNKAKGQIGDFGGETSTGHASYGGAEYTGNKTFSVGILAANATTTISMFVAAQATHTP